MKKMKPIPPEMQARFARTMRLLEERIAYHARKAADEQRGDSGSSAQA